MILIKNSAQVGSFRKEKRRRRISGGFPKNHLQTIFKSSQITFNSCVF